jgi:hypothetical protein
LGEPSRLTVFGRLAAVPARAVLEAPNGRRIEVRAPGATARTTEVRWDDTSERLLVGVWCGTPPLRLELPLKFPLPELAWFASFHLPGFAGDLARVSVERGLVSLVVPRMGSAHSTAIVASKSDEGPSHRDHGGPPAIPVAVPDVLDAQAA